MLPYLEITPLQLTGLLKQKSREGFCMLYDCYSAALFGHICKIVKDSAAAEDLLQDTFVKIWRKIDLYDAERGALFTWMLNIASYTSIDYLRSKQQLYCAKKMVIEESGCGHLPSDSTTENSIVKAELKLFIQKLETKYREVIELTFLIGYTHGEAAVILSLPLGTVKTRCRSGLQQLRLLYI